MAISVSIENAKLSFNDVNIFSGINFSLTAGKWLALLGESGVGKSSLLKSIAGLIPEAELKVSLSNDSSIATQISYMGQTDLLFPWLSVLNNVTIGYRLRGKYSADIQQQALHLLSLVNLQAQSHLYPHQLSGGMRQRVALIRTLLEERPIVLMDEPFSALDTVTRFKIHATAIELLVNKTVLFVTHDPLEALRLADEIYLLQPYPNGLRHLLSLTSEKPRSLNSTEVLQHQKVLYEYLI